VLMVDQRETTYSHSALAELAEQGAAVVICGRDHHPVAMCLPLSTNTELLSRLDAQLNASKPTCKRLWASIVAAKVLAQADALPQGHDALACQEKLRHLARSVRSGDPDNIEAQAAAVYWPVVFSGSANISHPFRRRAGERGAPAPNNLLDYGYSALRAAVARGLVSAGLLPALGVKHRGRSNPFCLADDLMEPLRPAVDRRARYLAERGELELTQPVKAELLGVLTDEVSCGNIGADGASSRGPLLVAVTRYIASFIRVISGETEKLDIPTLSERKKGDAPVIRNADEGGEGEE
jgi:CRISPR-associated protein Cas1